MPSLPASEIDRVYREEYGRAMAVLVRIFGDIDVAEEAVQDAFAAAVQRWPSTGLPPSPAGWIITTARNRAIDRLRREASREDRHAQAVLLQAGDEPVEEDAVQDDRLRLIFTCCHPALAMGRSCSSMTSCCRAPQAPWWPSTVRWPWLRLRGQTRHSPLSRVWTSADTTYSMPSEPICLHASAEAAKAYDAAITLANNAAERAFLRCRRDALSRRTETDDS